MLGLFLCAEEVSADIGLRLDPPVVYMQAEPLSETSFPIQLENTTGSIIQTSIQYLPFAPSKNADGTIEYLQDGQMYLQADRRIFGALSITENDQNVSEFSLAPKQKRQLVAKISLTKDIPVGDYYFSIVFLGENKAADASKSHTLIRAGIATNIVLSIKPDATSKIELADFRTDSLYFERPIEFLVRAQNESNNYTNVSGDITLTNMFGQTIGRMDVRKQAVLAKSSIYLGKRGLGDPSSLPAIIWNDGFLFGQYTARLQLKTAANQVIEDEISFVVIPFHIILGSFTLLVVLGFIIKRVRNHLHY